MNEPNSQVPERRYGERPVILVNKASEVLKGVSYTLYPVDEPPVIEVPSVGRRWYLDVWEQMGWTVL
jgi:hypothetical protein